MRKRFHKTLKLNGRTYTLHTKLRVVDNEAGITEGPFYKNNTGNTFLPDISYIMGITNQPAYMTWID